jgi:LuxR family maltose regulon positive regulatory protein
MVEGALLMAMLHELRIGPTELLEEGGDAPLTFLDGLLHTPAKIVPTAMPNALSMDAAMAVEGLTRKELQVLRLTAEGLSNDQIGERMFVAETTVRTHLRNINVKLDSRNRMEAVQVARRLGWLA